MDFVFLFVVIVGLWLAFMYLKLLYLLRKNNTVIEDRIIDPEYSYKVYTEDLANIIKEVINDMPPAKKKMLSNVLFKLDKTKPNEYVVKGKPHIIFGQYSAVIFLYPDNLLAYNKNYNEYLDHFRSLVKHEIAHHFGMSEDEITKNKKKLGITR